MLPYPPKIAKGRAAQDYKLVLILVPLRRGCTGVLGVVVLRLCYVAHPVESHVARIEIHRGEGSKQEAAFVTDLFPPKKNAIIQKIPIARSVRVRDRFKDFM